MRPPEEEGSIRRILVALDASPHSMAALKAAASLAARLGAEIQGLFIEDITILRLAELPVSRRVAVYTMQPRRLDREHLERELRAQARLARRALAEIASRSRLRWSFRVAQGMIPQELLSAAREVDLLILGKSGWSRSRRLGSTTLVMIRESPVGVMVLQQGGQLAMPISLLFDGSDASRRALAAAADLLPEGQDFLNVFIIAENNELAREYQFEVAAWLRAHDLRARFRWLVNNSPEALFEFMEAEGCGLMVMPARSNILPEQVVTELVNAMGCPVLFVH